MHAKQFSSPTKDVKPRRHFMQGGWPFLPKNPFLQVQCWLPGMVELDPAGQARQVDASEVLLPLPMGEKNPTGQPLLATADSVTG